MEPCSRPSSLDLTREQRDIQALCREFAEKEIRPISLGGRRGRHRDALGDLAQGCRARHHVVHAPRGVRRRRDDGHRDAVPRPGGAVLGLLGDRQPAHLGWVLRRAGARARHRGAEAALDRASLQPPSASHRSRHDRARLGLRRRLIADDRDARRGQLLVAGAEDLDLERRPRRVLRRVRDRRARNPLERHHRVSSSRETIRGSRSERRCARWASGRS